MRIAQLNYLNSIAQIVYFFTLCFARYIYEHADTSQSYFVALQHVGSSK